MIALFVLGVIVYAVMVCSGLVDHSEEKWTKDKPYQDTRG